uniref:Uncharacterized protein n=1 Tax=Lates calcarifer TaxID=8187 RepID=A0A4W6BUU1_LATCA
MLVLYSVLEKTGILSLISRTLINISDVPDFGGVPPSTAVSVKKYSLGFSLYVLILFFPTSAS